MADLSTNYLGLELSNPIVAASSGLTDSVEKIKTLEKNGVGAVVLKSLFEEEIIIEMNKKKEEMLRPGTIYPEIYDFFDYDDVEDSVTKYLAMLESAKKETSIPIIASVNCVSSDEWPVFAKRIEEAGADALELNVFVMPSDFNRSGQENEKIYFDVIDKVTKEVTIPISLKLSYYFSNLGQMLMKLSETGISGLTLFNRFYSPDFDIDNFKVVPVNVFSSPSELATSLRWIAIMANRVKCDLAASTGIHHGHAVVKQILAGADAVHVASTLYQNGVEYVRVMLGEINSWMEKNGFDKLDDFRGKMSQDQSEDPASFERVQFMKHFSGKNM